MWLYALMYVILQSWLYLLLMQPSSQLGFSQRMGLFWGVLVFSHVALVDQMLTRAQLLWLVEAQRSAVSGQVRLWLLDFLGFWLMYLCMFCCILPVMGLLYGLSHEQLLRVFLVWCVSAPALLMQMYLSRLIAMFMRRGAVVSLLVLLPWMVPNVLWVVICLGEHIAHMAMLRHSCVLLGGNMCLVLGLYKVIDYVLPRCYHHQVLSR